MDRCAGSGEGYSRPCRGGLWTHVLEAGRVTAALRVGGGPWTDVLEPGSVTAGLGGAVHGHMCWKRGGLQQAWGGGPWPGGGGPWPGGWSMDR